MNNLPKCVRSLNRLQKLTNNNAPHTAFMISSTQYILYGRSRKKTPHFECMHKNFRAGFFGGCLIDGNGQRQRNVTQPIGNFYGRSLRDRPLQLVHRRKTHRHDKVRKEISHLPIRWRPTKAGPSSPSRCWRKLSAMLQPFF